MIETKDTCSRKNDISNILVASFPRNSMDRNSLEVFLSESKTSSEVRLLFIEESLTSKFGENLENFCRLHNSVKIN